MKAKRILSVVIFIIFISGQLNAQGIKKFGSPKMVELGGTIYYTNTTYVHSDSPDYSFGFLQFQPQAGYFIYKGVELGLRPTIGVTFSGGNTLTETAVYFVPSYNFIFGGDVFPVISALVGFSSLSSSLEGYGSSKGFSWGAETGVKAHLLGNSLLLIMLQYRQENMSSPFPINSTRTEIFTVGAGWSVFF